MLVGKADKATPYDSVCVRGLEISMANPPPNDTNVGRCDELKKTEEGFRAVVWLPGEFLICGTGVGMVDIGMEIVLKNAGTVVRKKMTWTLSAKKLRYPWFAV
jgi:hypothetical protein